MTGKSLYDYCMEQNRQVILAEWDSKSNGVQSAHDIAGGSHKLI